MASNTTILGASMMLYMFFFVALIAYFLTATRSVGRFTVFLLGVANAVFFILPMITDVLFYDTWIWWIAAQIVANIVLIGCLAKEFNTSTTNLKWLCVGAALPLIAFAADVFGMWFGLWKNGMISQYVFAALFVVALIMVLNFI